MNICGMSNKSMKVEFSKDEIRYMFKSIENLNEVIDIIVDYADKYHISGNNIKLVIKKE